MYKWLKKYQTLQKQIDYLEYEILDFQLNIENLSKVPKNVVSESTDLGMKNKICEKEKELEYLIIRRQAILDFIYKFDDLESKILIKKYIENKKLFDIAEELNYSESYIYQKHSEIIKQIELIEKFTTNLP
ncbi:hypothetical protein [Vagococcus silagei]|uniref:DUF1492 domain-containing protein n=1 Tax=Vagococcus silagei TaxID=2508885 RepID=A0A4V3TVA8_9ENTE|nr:hypothetical protein [Vagococcus silagei]THB62179.1 hypothetical protein ESZ54_01160 [Vagococcus silagei]